MNNLAHPSFHPVDSTPHKKKVVIIIGQLGYGGAERQLYYYLSNHDRERFTPLVIVLNSRKPHTYEEAIRDQGIEVIQIPEDCRGLFRRMLAITRAIRELSPDIIHSWGFYTNPYASICGFLCGVRVRLGSLRSVPERMKQLDMHPIHRWIAYRMIHGLTVNSRTAVDQLMRMRYPTRKTFLVNNSVLVSPQHSAKREWKTNILRSDGIQDNHQLIGTIGNHRKVKNQAMFIKASATLMREFPGLRCLIIGRKSAVEPERGIK
jgi:glycosyltransferase involved in cell wall biosynthesis